MRMHADRHHPITSLEKTAAIQKLVTRKKALDSTMFSSYYIQLENIH